MEAGTRSPLFSLFPSPSSKKIHRIERISKQIYTSSSASLSTFPSLFKKKKLLRSEEDFSHSPIREDLVKKKKKKKNSKAIQKIDRVSIFFFNLKEENTQRRNWRGKISTVPVLGPRSIFVFHSPPKMGLHPRGWPNEIAETAPYTCSTMQERSIWNTNVWRNGWRGMGWDGMERALLV